MDDYTKKIIVIEHPTFMDAHVVCQVVKQTAKTITVIYWNKRHKHWNEAEARRNIPQNVVVLGNMGFVHETNIQLVSERLVSFSDQMAQRIKDARMAYAKRIRELHTP